MATAITPQSINSKLLGTIQLVNPESYSSGKKVDVEYWVSPVPEDELYPGVEADLAVDVYAFSSCGPAYDDALRVELEEVSLNDHVGFGYKVFVSHLELEVPYREHMLTYNHKHQVIFSDIRLPSTLPAAVENQTIGVALYYLLIDSKQNVSSSKEVPTLQQWLEKWPKAVRGNVRRQGLVQLCG